MIPKLNGPDPNWVSCKAAPNIHILRKHRLLNTVAIVSTRAGAARRPHFVRSSLAIPSFRNFTAGNAESNSAGGTLPHRKEEDLIHLYTTERTYDAIAQGDISALGLKCEFFIEAMVQNVIAALN